MAESKESEEGSLIEELGKKNLPVAAAAGTAAVAASSVQRSAAPAPAVANKAPGLMEEGLGEKRTESMVAKVSYLHRQREGRKERGKQGNAHSRGGLNGSTPSCPSFFFLCSAWRTPGSLY